ncbi:MAG: site-specific integrase [Thermodesulfobacteriota bacterium]
MGQKVPPGLINRGGTWHINKTVAGQRIRESTSTGDLAEAERYLAHRMEEVRLAVLYGVRPKRTFREAATRYLSEATKSSIEGDARQLRYLDPYIGDLPLEAVHMGTLQRFIRERKHQGGPKDKAKTKPVQRRTVNAALQTVRHILNLAASEWLDERGLTWLAHAPKIKLLREDDKREPYPLSWEEQKKLFAELPTYVRQMALFTVNTGCRDQEVCSLRWDWEVRVPALATSVFIIPRQRVKNRQDRLVVLNSIARQVIEEQRGEHPEFVFTHCSRRIWSMYNHGWKGARERAGLQEVRVHDLKHTFGRRLRAAGVSFEDRQDLLGHKSVRITTHYSAPELISLIEAAERVCGDHCHKSDTTVILRKQVRYLRAV